MENKDQQPAIPLVREDSEKPEQLAQAVNEEELWKEVIAKVQHDSDEIPYKETIADLQSQFIIQKRKLIWTIQMKQ
jgi:hypothetical protein